MPISHVRPRSRGPLVPPGFRLLTDRRRFLSRASQYASTSMIDRREDGWSSPETRRDARERSSRSRPHRRPLRWSQGHEFRTQAQSPSPSDTGAIEPRGRPSDADLIASRASLLGGELRCLSRAQEATASVSRRPQRRRCWPAAIILWQGLHTSASRRHERRSWLTQGLRPPPIGDPRPGAKLKTLAGFSVAPATRSSTGRSSAAVTSRITNTASASSSRRCETWWHSLVGAGWERRARERRRAVGIRNLHQAGGQDKV
jgi:hypothetical protein